MSEINCLVLLNNPEKEIVLNMDNHVSYAMFNDEVRKSLQIYPGEPIQYSYFDEEGDRVLFNTEEEFKEFLAHASSIGFMMTIFAYAQPKPAPSAEPLPATSTSIKNKPAKPEKKQKAQPQFNVKYQLPVGRVHRNKPNLLNPKGNNQTIVRCDYCKQEITNLRYKCLQCPDYDLCERCEDLKCKLENNNNQIHSDDHIFAKIRSPIQRPVPFICAPGNSPIVCARHGLRRIPVAPEHMRTKKEPKTSPTKINPNPSGLSNNEDRKVKRGEKRTNDRREGMKKVIEQRGEKIIELENRVQELEQQFTSLKASSPTPKRVM